MASISKIKKDLLRNAYFFCVAFFLWTLFFAFGIIDSESRAFSEEPAYDPHGRRDPLIPLVTLTAKASTGLAAVESIEDVTIEGVVYDPKAGSVVVVNGSVMKEGEESGNIKVLQIMSDGAWFSINGVRAYKPMYQGDTLKERAA